MARPYQKSVFDYSTQPEYQSGDHLHVDKSQIQGHPQEYEISTEQDNLFSVSPSHYREADTMQYRQSQHARQQHGAQQYHDRYPISPAGRIDTRQTSQSRVLRQQSLPHQQHRWEQMVTTSLSNHSPLAYASVGFSSATFRPRGFRDNFGLGSQELERYSPTSKSVSSDAVMATAAVPRGSHYDIVARDGQHGRGDMVIKYPHPSVLPTVEEYQQHRNQQEQHSQQRRQSHQRRQSLHEDQQQQQHDRHGYRLPDGSPPTKVFRSDSAGVALHQSHLETTSIVGREGMPQPAQRPEEPKVKFTPEDDQLLVDLKEKYDLTWKQIAEFFPGRSSGTLQVRYCTKLKVKATVWTEETLQKLQVALQGYEADRWRVVSTKVGSGFSAAACKAKAAEVHPDVYEDDPEPDAGLEEAEAEVEGEKNIGESDEETDEEVEREIERGEVLQKTSERQKQEKMKQQHHRHHQEYTESGEEEEEHAVDGDDEDDEKDSDGEGTSKAEFEVDDTGQLRYRYQQAHSPLGQQQHRARQQQLQQRQRRQFYQGPRR